MKKKEKVDKNVYESPIAQSIEASGNFISRSNPVFIILLIVLIGLGVLAYKYLVILELKISSAPQDPPAKIKKHQN